MTPDWIVYTCLALGLTSALVAGVFGAFSTFVMSGLLRAAPVAGIDAMQQINVTVLRSAFLYAFFLLVPASVGLAIYAGLSGAGASTAPIIAAAVINVGSVFVVTVFGNVPMNERLAKLDARTAEAADYWAVYGSQWTRWNHLRSLGSTIAAICYLAAAVAV